VNNRLFKIFFSGLIAVYFFQTQSRSAPPPLSVQRHDATSVLLSWANTPGEIVLEVTEALSPPVSWARFPGQASLVNGQLTLSVDAGGRSQFFRLHQIAETGGDTTITAPAFAQGVTSILGKETEFLHSGPAAVQTGVAAGAFETKRAAVVRGKVRERNAAALAGVLVTIPGHPEYGQTLTRTNGFFDLQVNGGGSITVQFEKVNYCPVQRQVYVPWQDFVTLPEVAMIKMDPVVTPVTFGSGSSMQVHRASMQTDASGNRRSTIFFPAGTSASLVMPDGSMQAAGSLHIRATEFTVGPDGPAAMPGVLPPLSGYTYCVEFSADEAVAAGALSVQFSQPLFAYLENFLQFPAGSVVPLGFYDRQKGTWEPLPNGRIIKILRVNNGTVEIDTDGDNAADDGLGIGADERKFLASSYSAAQTLWRMPVLHFSPQDANWPYSNPDDAKTPAESGAGPDGDESQEEQCVSNGSIIECENQVLGQAVPIVGTPYTLNYRSDRVPGQPAARTIRLSGAAVPVSLQSIDLHLSVAGQDFDQTFAASPNQQTAFVWNRRDAYGRPTIGGQTLNVTIDYNYPTTYQEPGPFPAAFNQPGGATLTANPTRSQIAISDHFTTTIGDGLTDARTIGLGGWTLNVHQLFDPVARMMHSGAGTRRRAATLGRILTSIDLPGRSVLFDVAAGPDGSIYVALPHNDLIVRVAPDGSQKVIAGTGVEGYNGDGIPATQAQLGDPAGIAVGPDGSVYIGEESNFRVRRISPDGMISTVAGNGNGGSSGDGGPATQASFSRPGRLAVGPDGSLLLFDGGVRIRKVTTDGIIRTVAGNGAIGFSGDGGPATEASINCAAVGATADGGFYVADFFNHRVRYVTRNGIINTVADYSPEGGSPVSVNVTPEGDLYLGLNFTGAKTPRIDLLKRDGTRITVAGGGNTAIQEGIPAAQANLTALRAVILGPDGSLFLAPGDGGSRLLRVGPVLPGIADTATLIASDDARQLYLFDERGRHIRTINALSGNALFEFGYDEQGRLTRIAQKLGETENVTTIEHDSAGNPTAIVGPFGQKTVLAVDQNGFLASITNPAGEKTQFTSDAGGLMQTYTDPAGNANSFQFDAQARLVMDTEPDRGTQALARSSSANGFTVTRTTALGRNRVHSVTKGSGNVQQRTIVEPGGARSTSTTIADAGTTHAVAPDGTTTDLVLSPDPRFAMQSPLASSLTVQTPGGRKTQVTSTVSAKLSDASNPLSVQHLTTTTTINGRSYSSDYEVATRTLISSTPIGQRATSTYDLFGRLVTEQAPGLHPVTYQYDARGRLTKFSQGSGAAARTLTINYNEAGLLASIIDPLNRATSYTYDKASRVTSATRSDGASIKYAYDERGNLNSYLSPSGGAYAVSYNARNLIASHTPPPIDASSEPLTYEYNQDRQLTKVQLSTSHSVANTYDAVSGKRLETTLSRGSYRYSYDPQSGQLKTLTAPDGNEVLFEYDGAQIQQVQWSGTIKGTVADAFDNNFRIVSETVNGQLPVSYVYDNNGTTVAIGSLALKTTRHSVGFTRSTTLGTVTDSSDFDGFSERTKYEAKINSASAIRMMYERDLLGRITRKTETIQNATDVFEYEYDLGGRLTKVVKNGASLASYSYDPSGNRLTALTAEGTTTAIYDPQERMVRYGDSSYRYDDAGQLASKTIAGRTTSYNYDELGNLLRVSLPQGTTIEYVVDGRDRRIGRKVNGALVKGFLYHDGHRPAAELNAANEIVSRFVYAGGPVRYMIKGGDTFRIITDELGSPRLVINTATGAIVQRMDYDAFGNVILDTAPGLQPFGFAGGLYDPETKLTRFGIRDYDAETGRWTAREMGAPLNGQDVYSYVNNDPINAVDPLGANPEDEFDEITIVEAPNWDVRQEVRHQIERAEQKLGQLREEMSNLRRSSGKWLSLRNDRETQSNLISELRRKAQGLEKEANGAAHSGGFLGKVLCVFNFVDLAEVAVVAAQSGHTFWEEIDIQDAAERAEAAERGVHKIISCLGTLCVTTEIDENGNRLQQDPFTGQFYPEEI
jgi:RHS repeat-associated protein